MKSSFDRPIVDNSTPVIKTVKVIDCVYADGTPVTEIFEVLDTKGEVATLWNAYKGIIQVEIAKCECISIKAGMEALKWD